MSRLTFEQWQSLSLRLDEALGMTEVERAVFISSMYPEDPFIAMYMEELLREHKLLTEIGFLEKRAWNC